MSFIRVQRHNLNIYLAAFDACKLPFGRLRYITLTAYFLLEYNFLFTRFSFTLTLLGTQQGRKTKAGRVT
jgi:hypothetical protein